DARRGGEVGMPAAAFEFIEAYRKMRPEGAKEVVEARQKGHAKLYPLIKEMQKVYELCRLSFQLPQDLTTLVEWFQKAIRESDPQFTLEVDKAEAGRIASLLLREFISTNNAQVSLAVLAASYCGRRETVDDKLVQSASAAIAEIGRSRRIALTEQKIV